MGASRILSAKKHSEKVSKYSALLYASSAHTSFPHPSLRDPGCRHKAGFLSRLEPLGCGRLFFIGCSVVYFGCLCVKDESLLFFLKWRNKSLWLIQLLQLLYGALLQHDRSPGCRWMFFIGRRAVYFDSLCIIEDESLLLSLTAECKTNPVLKINCLTSLA